MQTLPLNRRGGNGCGDEKSPSLAFRETAICLLTDYSARHAFRYAFVRRRLVQRTGRSTAERRTGKPPRSDTRSPPTGVTAMPMASPCMKPKKVRTGAGKRERRGIDELLVDDEGADGGEHQAGQDRAAAHDLEARVEHADIAQLVHADGRGAGAGCAERSVDQASCTRRPDAASTPIRSPARGPSACSGRPARRSACRCRAGSA